MNYSYLRIGKIVNTHGIKGELKILPLTDYVERFNELNYVYIDDEKLIKMDIQYVKYSNNLILLKFVNLDDINDVEKYKNSYILINRENAIKLPSNSYFICDLIGLKVFDTNNNLLGNIADVNSCKSNDIYVLDTGKKQILIPALKSVVKEINIVEGKMIVELPEGLD